MRLIIKVDFPFHRKYFAGDNLDCKAEQSKQNILKSVDISQPST